jgi:hypothetical protein
VTSSEFIAELAQATKEQIAAVTAPLLERIAALEAKLAAAPELDVVAAKAALLVPRPVDGRDAQTVDVDAIAAKAALMIPRPADGKDAPAVDVDAIAVKAAALIPPPMPGRDGKDADPAALVAMQVEIAGIKAAMVEPRHGRDGKDVDMAAVWVAIEGAVAKAIAALPVPKDGKDGMNGKDGKDGASVEWQRVEAVIAERVKQVAVDLPVPKDGRDGVNGKDGRDVDPAMLETVIEAHVTKAVAALPVPKDGASVTLDDVQPLVVAEVTKAVAALPKAVDGVGISHALVDRAGELVLTLTDGSTKAVGKVVGADADPAEVKRLVIEQVDAIPRPKDGKDGAPGKDGQDGLGIDDSELVLDDAKGYIMRWSNANRVKEQPVAFPVPRGVYKPGVLYHKWAMVTAQGSQWMAEQDTRERPGEGSTSWRLIVKRGRDGRDLRGEP